MYIPHQQQQAIHQDVVNDGLRQSERRRLLKTAAQEISTEATGERRAARARLFALVLNLVARPS